MAQNLVEVSLKQTEIFSIFSSVTSIILGIIAIWLSVVFFRMSDKTSKEAEKSASSIDASVKKLELLFEKLYSGTFDIMKETVTDMRKHVYSVSSSTQELNNEKINSEIYQKNMDEVAATIKEIKSSQKTDSELQKLIMDVIESTKQTEKDIKRSVVREEVISYLRVTGQVTFGQLHKYMLDKQLIKRNDPTLFNELVRLANEGITNYPFEHDDELGGLSVSHNAKVFLQKNY